MAETGAAEGREGAAEEKAEDVGLVSGECRGRKKDVGAPSRGRRVQGAGFVVGYYKKLFLKLL